MITIVLFFCLCKNCQKSYRQYTTGFVSIGRGNPAICYIFRPLRLHSNKQFKTVGNWQNRLVTLFRCRDRDTALEQWKEMNQQDFCIYIFFKKLLLKIQIIWSVPKVIWGKKKAWEMWIPLNWRWRGLSGRALAYGIRYKCTYPKAWNADLLILMEMPIILCFRNT